MHWPYVFMAGPLRLNDVLAFYGLLRELRRYFAVFSSVQRFCAGFFSTWHKIAGITIA